jgi:hypothetical protein
MVQIRSKLAPYASLVLGKLVINVTLHIGLISTVLSRAVTIAIRYCTVRRQFIAGDGDCKVEDEVQVINYQMVSLSYQ